MVVNSVVHSSLHTNCHHQIVYEKLDLKIYYPPPTNAEFGFTKRLMTFLLDVRRTVHEFSWKRAFSNLNVDED